MDRPDDAALLAEADECLRKIAPRDWDGMSRIFHNREFLVRDLSAALRAALQREQENNAAYCREVSKLEAELEAAERELSTLRARTEQDGAGLIHQPIPDMAGTEPRPSGEALGCSWACSLCVKAGGVKPWRWAAETIEDAVSRHNRETRERCVSGCLYSARIF